MEEALIKRVRLTVLRQEQSVVGAMLMDKEAILTASEIITGQDFYQTSYGVIFESMVELFNEGKPADLITLQERLKKRMYRRDYQSGICPRAGGSCADFCQCKILCADRI